MACYASHEGWLLHSEVSSLSERVWNGTNVHRSFLEVVAASVVRGEADKVSPIMVMC